MGTDADKTNKSVVTRFNKEVIEHGDQVALNDLLAPEFVNHSAPPGMPTGAEGMRYMFEEILRPAIPDLLIDIHDQVAEGDRVVTRKTIRGTHRGALFGIPATSKPVSIEVIDIFRVKGGRLIEHWGLNTLSDVLAQLKTQ